MGKILNLDACLTLRGYKNVIENLYKGNYRFENNPRKYNVLNYSNRKVFYAYTNIYKWAILSYC